MTKRINYLESISAGSQDAKDSIDTLTAEKSNGNITGFSIEYRDDVGAVKVHVWKEVPTADDLPAGYNSVDTALSNLPVSLPSAADNAPVHNR